MRWPRWTRLISWRIATQFVSKSAGSWKNSSTRKLESTSRHGKKSKVSGEPFWKAARSGTFSTASITTKKLRSWVSRTSPHYRGCLRHTPTKISGMHPRTTFQKKSPAFTRGRASYAPARRPGQGPWSIGCDTLFACVVFRCELHSAPSSYVAHDVVHAGFPQCHD